MCGIFALFLRRPLDDRDLALGRAGRDALAHRGPDGYGEWFDRDKGVYLGHRRLAIIDPSEASNQPLVRQESAITYNGELYNFRSLRTQLEQAGQRFQTTGDVEVMLQAWRKWRTDALPRLDGMFAFALWDGREGYLAVDPFAEKPLYYAETDDGIYVASEITPLVDLLHLRPRLSAKLLAGYLALGYIQPPETIYPVVRKLRPATVLRIGRGRVVDETRYWQAPRPEAGRGAVQPLSEAELDRLQQALGESLAGRLITDVPMGIFLSSGVDSGLVAAMARRDHGADVEAISVSFPGSGENDEAPLAARTARHLGLPHRIVNADAQPDGDDVARLLDLFGQPCDAATALSIQQMTAAAHSICKVGLTGSGGDEITFGYGKHAHFFRQRRLYGLPQSVRLGIGHLLRPFRGLSGIALRISEQIGTRDTERFLAQKNFPTIEWLRQLAGFTELCDTDFAAGEMPLDLFCMYYEQNEVMPGLRLPSMDIGSMRSSVELRTPFLSRQVVEAVAACDPRAFVAFGQKSVLRRLLRRYLPAELVDLPKRGFVYPQERLLAFRRQPPRALPLLGQQAINTIWREAEKGQGWHRIAVRIAILAAFTETQGVEMAVGSDRPANP